jgi:hypothetical protein
MEELSELFNLVAAEKKKKKLEMESLVGDSFEKLFVEQLKSHKSPEQLAKKHKVPVSQIKTQLKKGTKVEKEHTKDVELATTIASQHIDELPDYYDRLSKVEKSPMTEGLLNILPQEKTPDPLSPLNQNFATLDDLQKHYKLFLNRIQQQLSTLGGGGETNLTYMDVPVTSVTTSSYTIRPQDYYIGVNYAGAVTITLPRADREGKIFVVKDELGEASKGTNRYITILPSESDLIDGRDRAILAFDFGSLTFIWKSNSWRVV